MGAEYPQHEPNVPLQVVVLALLPLSYAGISGDGGFRSRCLRLDGAALSRLSYITMAPAEGFEPSHFGLTVRCPAVRPREINSAGGSRTLIVRIMSPACFRYTTAR